MSHVCRTLAMALISYRVCVFVCGRIVWMTSTLLDNVNISSFAIAQRVCHNLNALARHSVVMRTKKWRMCSLHISNHYQFSRQPHTKHAAWRKILFFSIILFLFMLGLPLYIASAGMSNYMHEQVRPVHCYASCSMEPAEKSKHQQRA